MGQVRKAFSRSGAGLNRGEVFTVTLSGNIIHNCPVCDKLLDTATLSAIVLDTPRGKQPWAKCPECRSFFLTTGYEAGREVEHTRTRPWGIVESGIALAGDRAPMFEAILRALETFAQKGSEFLDVGCSYGGFLQAARKKGYKVRGMDIVPEAVEHVRGLGIPCEQGASVGDLNIAENSQGVISVLDCNYYWPSQKKEIRAIHSKLRPAGLLVMRVVDMSWLMQIGLWVHAFFPEAGKRLCERAVYDHRVSIPVRTLLRTVRQERFEVVYASVRDALPFRVNSLKIRMLYAVGMITRAVIGINLAPGFVFIARKRST